MVRMNGRSGISFLKRAKQILAGLLVISLVLTLSGCGSPSDTEGPPIQLGKWISKASKPTGHISEVSPPDIIQTLRRDLENYQPQVSIVSPKPDEVLDETTVKVKLDIKDLPIFKDKSLGLGPHLHVILDNQPYQPVYDLSNPLVLEEVSPGTHTLRVFASRPWHESFKNAGAFAQTTFHILAKTPEQAPDPQKPLLTYSRPTGRYGAEPIMLDFYLTNAPLHLVAAEQPDDSIPDWKIRCTVNGSSFIVDRWEPIYLKGFKPGKNWIQLELLDDQDRPIENVFNDTVRLFTYEPKGNDTLSQLMRNEVKVAEVRGITDPTYVPAPPAPPSPEPSSEPAFKAQPSPSPVENPIPVPAPSPSPDPTPTPKSKEESQAPPSPSPKNQEEVPPLKGPEAAKAIPLSGQGALPEVVPPSPSSGVPAIVPPIPETPIPAPEVKAPIASPTPVPSPSPIPVPEIKAPVAPPPIVPSPSPVPVPPVIPSSSLTPPAVPSRVPTPEPIAPVAPPAPAPTSIETIIPPPISSEPANSVVASPSPEPVGEPTAQPPMERARAIVNQGKEAIAQGRQALAQGQQLVNQWMNRLRSNSVPAAESSFTSSEGTETP